jgi:CheY-like chemotaxis protein
MDEIYDDVSILLVDDDDIDAMAIERCVSRLKLSITIYRARNGLQALDMLRDGHTIKHPYIILLDLNMPVMGGVPFLHKLRGDDALKRSIVFVLTTSSADEDRVAAYNENIAGYIVKTDAKEGMNNIIKMLDSYSDIVLLPK